jgi:hypothetical protein
MGRDRRNTQENDWKKKLQPLFSELAELNREFEQRWAQMQENWRRELGGPDSAPTQNDLAALIARDKAALEQWFEKRLVEINNRYRPIQYNPIAYSYLTLDPPTPDSEGIVEYLHFHRHGESLSATQTKDAKGDLDAWDKIARTGKDVRIIAFGKGPIKPFQGDTIHRQLLQLVICYERDPLTAEELAQCFDEYCAFGEDHDADALRKMRNRFEAELRAQ